MADQDKRIVELDQATEIKDGDFSVLDNGIKSFRVAFLQIANYVKSKIWIAATNTVAGVMKLYQAAGNNTDGTMSQAAITNLVDDAISGGIYTGMIPMLTPLYSLRIIPEDQRKGVEPQGTKVLEANYPSLYAELKKEYLAGEAALENVKGTIFNFILSPTKLRFYTYDAYNARFALCGDSGGIILNDLEGSITLPKTNNYLRPTDDTAQIGAYQDDTMRPITGEFNGYGMVRSGTRTGAFKVGSTGAIGSSGQAPYENGIALDSTLLGDNYSGEQTQPKSQGVYLYFVCDNIDSVAAASAQSAAGSAAQAEQSAAAAQASAQDAAVSAQEAQDAYEDILNATYTKAQIDGKIEAEKTRAETAEGTLQGNIDAEATARAAGDADALASAKTYTDATAEALQDNIDAEKTRAETAEQNIASDLAGEISRAQTAETSNAGAISAEVTRAQAAEQALANSKQANLTTEQLAVVNENPFTDDDKEAIEENTENISGNASDISDIKAKIPSAASSGNQLADKDFVNSSITHQASNSVYADEDGNQFASRAALLAADTFYRNGEEYTPSNNDYTIILADEDAPAPFTGGQTRWKWTGTPPVLGYEFGINETPFTSSQAAAINSGLTSTDKSNLDAHLGDTTKHITAAERSAWNAKQAALSTEQLAVVNNEPYTAADKTKLDNIVEGTPPDNATVEVNAGVLRVKPQTTLSTIAESTAKFAASTTLALGDFFNNVVAKINGLITTVGNKLDKKSTEGDYVYLHNGSSQNEKAYTLAPTASTIAERTSAGTLRAATATDGTDLVPLAQMNTALSNVSTTGGRSIGELYWPASNSTEDNPGGVGVEGGAYFSSGSTLYPTLYAKLKTGTLTSRTISKEDYDAQIAATGECDKWVLDEVAGSIRFPTIKPRTKPTPDYDNGVQLGGPGAAVNYTAAQDGFINLTPSRVTTSDINNYFSTGVCRVNGVTLYATNYASGHDGSHCDGFITRVKTGDVVYALVGTDGGATGGVWFYPDCKDDLKLHPWIFTNSQSVQLTTATIEPDKLTAPIPQFGSFEYGGVLQGEAAVGRYLAGSTITASMFAPTGGTYTNPIDKLEADYQSGAAITISIAGVSYDAVKGGTYGFTYVSAADYAAMLAADGSTHGCFGRTSATSFVLPIIKQRALVKSDSGKGISVYTNAEHTSLNAALSQNMRWEYSLYSDGYLQTSFSLPRDIAPGTNMWIKMPVKYKDDFFFGIKGSGYNNSKSAAWSALDIYNISDHSGTGDGEYLFCYTASASASASPAARAVASAFILPCSVASALERAVASALILPCKVPSAVSALVFSASILPSICAFVYVASKILS